MVQAETAPAGTVGYSAEITCVSDPAGFRVNCALRRLLAMILPYYPVTFSLLPRYTQNMTL